MERRGTCGLCQGKCKVILTIEGGKIVKMVPDRESPAGRVCPRGAVVPKALYDETRITKPLLRVGERGEGKFKEVTWEEAFTHAAELLQDTMKEYGGKSLTSYYGRGVLGTPVTRLYHPAEGEKSFLEYLESPNDGSCGSICYVAANEIAPALTTGLITPQMEQDIEHCDYIFAWGKNSVTDDGPQWMLKRIQDAHARGAKLIVIDPRKSGLGEIADWWIPMIPGADGALAQAMLKMIIEEKRYDVEFVENFTHGFEAYRSYLSTLELEALSRDCGVSLEDIKKLTDLFCSTEKIPLLAYTGLEYQMSGIQNIRAIFVLWAITGKLDVPGGIYLNADHAQEYPFRKVPEVNKPIGAEEFPIFYGFAGTAQFLKIPRAILEDDPYPVRGMVIVGGSPALSFPDSRKWREAYKKLKCLIVLDRYMTEDARYADVVFPAGSLFEVPNVFYEPEGAVVEEPVIPPVGEAKSDVLIMAGIAEKLGFGAAYPQTEEELRDWMKSGRPPYSGAFCRGQKKKPREHQKYKTGLLRADGKFFQM